MPQDDGTVARAESTRQRFRPGAEEWEETRAAGPRCSFSKAQELLGVSKWNHPAQEVNQSTWILLAGASGAEGAPAAAKILNSLKLQGKGIP